MKKPTIQQISVISITLLLAASAVDAEWWNYDWEYRKSVAISSAADLSDHQVALNVTYSGRMQEDFDDLRFSDLDGLTELPYWIEQKTDSGWAYVWVKVPSITASNGTAAYMYYSNLAARSTSNCSGTFVFCDDFSGDRLDWAASWQSSDQEVYSSSVSHLYCSNTSRPDDKIETQSSFSGYVFESKLRTSDIGADGFYMLLNPVFGVYSSYEGIGIAVNEFVIDMSDSAVFAGGSASEDVYYIFSFRLPAVGNATAAVYSDGRGEELFTLSGEPGYRDAYMGFLMSAPGTGYVDWALVREYSSAEPVVSLGGEEWMNSPPDDPSPELWPDAAYSDSNISCIATYWDLEGDDGTLTFDLSVNGGFAARCPPRDVVDNTELECSLLAEIDDYGGGDVINCTVTSIDNNSQATVSWVSRIVRNSPPTAPMQLLPVSGVYSGAVALNCSGSTDPDDDMVYYDLQTDVTGSWEDVAVEDDDGVFLWENASVYDMDGVGLRCRATDLLNASEYFTAPGSFVLDNTPPQVLLNESVSDYLAVLDRLWAAFEFYSDEALDSCLMEWDGSNESANVSGVRCVFNKTDSVGNHTFRAWASDIGGNFNVSSEHWVFFSETTTTTTTTLRGGGGGGGGGAGGGGGVNAAKPKVSCFDGIRNQGEKETDCGGPCEACPSCSDGLQNQGESGIDCGGPCSVCKAVTTSTSQKKNAATTTTSKTEASTTTVRTLATTMAAGASSSAVPLGLSEGTIILSVVGLIVLSVLIRKGKM